MNKVMLLGRLTKDPEVKYTKQELVIARYTLAVARRMQQQGQQEVDFINCIVFGKSAEFAEKYIKKGQQIAVVGRLKVQNWQDQNGQTHWSTDVIVDEHYFADSNKKKTEESGFYPVDENENDNDNDNDNDFPF